MALNFNLNKIANYETKCLEEDKTVKPLTRNLIFATMGVDMGAITEANAEEFYNRLHYGNALLHWGMENVTLDDVKAHVGLTTNVSTTTWTQFVKKVAENWCRFQGFKPSSGKKKAKA